MLTILSLLSLLLNRIQKVISIFLNLQRFDFCLKIWSVLEKHPCTFFDVWVKYSVATFHPLDACCQLVLMVLCLCFVQITCRLEKVGH